MAATTGLGLQEPTGEVLDGLAANESKALCVLTRYSRPKLSSNNLATVHWHTCYGYAFLDSRQGMPIGHPDPLLKLR